MKMLRIMKIECFRYLNVPYVKNVANTLHFFIDYITFSYVVFFRYMMLHLKKIINFVF